MQKVAVKKRRKISNESVCGTFMGGLPVLGFAIFGLIPMLVAIYMAFMNTRFTLENLDFVGFDNFATVLKDRVFWSSVANTLIFAISTPISIVLSLMLAVLLDSKIKGKRFFRTVFFLPYVCSVVAVTLMFRWIFDANYGIVNAILNSFGFKSVPFLTTTSSYRFVINFIGVWEGTGFGIILYSAALTKINVAYYEAAKIDGANVWQSFRHITLPAISPTTFYLLVMGLIGGLQQFSRVQILSGSTSSTGNLGMTMVLYLYIEAFSNHNMGVASASAWIIAVMILGVTVLNFALSKRWVSYD